MCGEVYSDSYQWTGSGGLRYYILAGNDLSLFLGAEYNNEDIVILGLKYITNNALVCMTHDKYIYD